MRRKKLFLLTFLAICLVNVNATVAMRTTTTAYST